MFEKSLAIILNVISNLSIGPRDRTLTGTSTPNQSGLGSNENEEGSPYLPKLKGWS